MAASTNDPSILILANEPESVDALGELLTSRGVRFASGGLEGVALDPKRKPVAALLVRRDGEEAQIDAAATRLQADGISPVIWGVPSSFTLADGTRVQTFPRDAAPEELAGALAAAAHYLPLIGRMDREISQLERVGAQLGRYFEEVDNEMRLAGRLQRDFLPQRPPRVPGVRFAHVYRPASWVSGDLFDTIELDKRHAGMFIGDAMGHGASAALLTMFIRKALRTHRIEAPSEIVPPAEAIALLSAELEKQALPHSQFVTAAYAVLDTATRELRVARGGHPFPLRIAADGTISELTPDGGLLGIAGLPMEFGEQTVTLLPGEKVIFYTDGLEELFIKRRDDAGLAIEFGPELQEWVRGDIEGVCTSLCACLDGQEGSLNPADDVTIVGLQIE